MYQSICSNQDFSYSNWMNLILIVSRCGRVYVASVGFRNELKHRSESGTRGLSRRTGTVGFTLIELLAVVVVILILTGLVIRVAGYAQYRMAVSTTKAQLATIQAALEMYKADWGYYPRTNPERLSSGGDKQGSNNFLLYVSLAPVNVVGITNFAGSAVQATIIRANRTTYMRFPAAQIRTNFATQYINSLGLMIAVPNIYDAWGKPIVYYNSSQTTLSSSSSGTNIIGGQVNATSYDLFSFGPDCYTYNSYNPGASGWTGLWTNPATATDDITGGSR